MDSSFNPTSSTLLSDLPISLFPTPSASQAAFLAMREGAHNHHLSVINTVLESDPIKEFVAAKASSSHHPFDAFNHDDFPPLQEVRAPNRPLQQADLAFITPPSSPCSPQVSNLTAAGSSSSQRGVALMHLSPPLMEKLEADLVLLQKKYGLGSQSLTPDRIPHPDASSVQANLFSSKLAAMGTFVSPLRHTKVTPPSNIRTEAPLVSLAKDASSPYHSPISHSKDSSQILNCALTVRGNAPFNPLAQFMEIQQSTNSIELDRVSAPPTAPSCSVITPSVSGNVPQAVRRNVPQSVSGDGPSTDHGNPQVSVRIAPPTGLNYSVFTPTVPPTVCPTVREKAPLSDRGNPRVSVRGNAPPIAQNCTVSAQNCTEHDRGNAPLSY